MKREIEDRKYLRYLLQSLNKDDIKQICRDYAIRGYSKYNKVDLIEFVLDSLAMEEIQKVINEKEEQIISKEFNTALDIINGKARESLEKISIVNPDRNEIELSFKGFNWTVGSFLSITKNNIENPMRDCDCRSGSNMGLCEHFWVGFIFSLKKGFFDLSEWSLTPFPEKFKERIDSITISFQDEEQESKEEQTAILIDENSDTSQLMEYIGSRITVLESEIDEVLKQESEFQEIITVYYVLKVKNAKFVPQVDKKSDVEDEEIVEVESLNIRISENAYETIKPQEGDKFGCNGAVNRDNFWGFILKRATKYEIL
jgi:hypothetical protein